MNGLEALFKIGVVGKNVPHTLEQIEMKDESMQEAFKKLMTEYEYEFVEYLVCLTYADASMDYGDGLELDHGAAWRFIGAEESGDRHENFIYFLNELFYVEVIGIDVDFENEKIIVF